MARKTDKQVQQYLAKIGRKGGKSRAAKHDKATLSRWAKMGGRPRKNTSKRKGDK
jgi:hypothetical protein